MAGLDLNATMDALGVALAAISGLRVWDYPPDNITVPAAIVAFPDAVVYDLVAGRGADRATFKIHVLVGKVSERTARDRIAPYVTGQGSSSVKAALEGAAVKTWDTLRVQQADVTTFTIGAVQYLGATFEADVIG